VAISVIGLILLFIFIHNRYLSHANAMTYIL
jgi:hypothetical protein